MSVEDYQSTALLVHAKNWELPIPADPSLLKPSLDTRLTAEAAGILFIQGLGNITFKKMILSGGLTAGQEYIAEADSLYNLIRSGEFDTFDTDKIPEEAIIRERKSYDTATNFRFSNEYYEEHGIDSIASLTVWYHAPRVSRLGRRISSVPLIDVVKSDEVIRTARNEPPHYYARRVIREVGEYKNLKPVVRLVTGLAMEAGAMSLALVDPSGEGISSKVTSKIRNQ